MKLSKGQNGFRWLRCDPVKITQMVQWKATVYKILYTVSSKMTKSTRHLWLCQTLENVQFPRNKEVAVHKIIYSILKTPEFLFCSSNIFWPLLSKWEYFKFQYLTDVEAPDPSPDPSPFPSVPSPVSSPVPVHWLDYLNPINDR